MSTISRASNAPGPYVGSATDTDPKYEATCKNGDQVLKVLFSSKSGEASEDDMTVLIKSQRGDVQLSVEPTWYHKAGINSAFRSLCDVIPGFAVGKNRLLLFLTPDGRPGYNNLTLVLFDTEKNQVLDVKERIDSLKMIDPPWNVYTVRLSKGNIEVRLIYEDLKGTGNDGPYNAIEEWKVITVQNNKIKTYWKSSL